MRSVRNWLALLGVAVALGASAQDLNAIKAAMLARKPTVDALLAKQTVGENNRGFVEALKAVPAPDGAVIEAENSDRKAVYEAIAKKTGAQPQAVGQQRAAEIVAKAAPGTMIQSPKGNWVAKPAGR
jgi:uncharacterized protein YdbL (DUF1318 family)